MKFEQLILSFVAIVFGLFVAGIAFFIYQSTKTVSPNNIKTIKIQNTSPTPGAAVPLTIDSPVDESVSTTKVITVSGKTDPAATVIVSTDGTDTVVTPTSMGAFSLTVTLTDNENILRILAVMPDGKETLKTLTVNYTTEDF
jgi:hypothetical protein